MFKNPIPNPGFVQIFKEGIMLTLSWEQEHPGGVINYIANVAMITKVWKSSQLMITVTDQSEQIMQGAWLGIEKFMPALWGEMAIAPDHLKIEMRNHSHLQTFARHTEFSAQIMEQFRRNEVLYPQNS